MQGGGSDSPGPHMALAQPHVKVPAEWAAQPGGQQTE